MRGRYNPDKAELLTYPIMGGVDSKIDPLMLPAPKLQSVENAWADRSGSLQRRYGRLAVTGLDMAGATVTNWLASARHQGRLLGFTSNRLYDYGEAESRWVNRGRCTSWRVRAVPVAEGDHNTAARGGRDMAIIGAYRCIGGVVYDKTAGSTSVVVTLMDDMGTRYAADLVLATTASVRAAAVSVVAFGTRFYVVYYDVSTAATIKCFTIDTTSAATIASSLVGTPASVATDLELHGGFYAVLDIASNPVYGPFLAYRSTSANTIKFGFISTAGAFTSTSTTSSGAADPQTISVAIAPGSAMHGISWTLGTAPNDIYAALRSWNGAAWTVTATSGAMDTAMAAAPAGIGRTVTSFFQTATTLQVLYVDAPAAGPTSGWPCTRLSTFTTGGTITSRVLIYPRAQPVSRPFTGLDDNYVWLGTTVKGTATVDPQPTLFLMSMSGVLAGVAMQNVASISTLQAYNIGHVAALNGSYSLAYDFESDIGVASSTVELIVEMEHAQSHVTVEDGGCSVIPSAILQQFDGARVTEQGFLQYVDTQAVALSSANSTGSLTSAAGTLYGYRFTYEKTNAQGQRERSTDNGPKITPPFVLNDDTVTAVIPTLPWTLKSDVEIVVWRTLANPTADSAHFKVGVIMNDPTTDTVTFIDMMSDAVAATKAQLNYDVELDAIAPPAGYIVAAGNGRVFVAGAAEDPNMVWYSKTRGHGEPLTFNDALKVPFPADNGPITSLVVFNDSLVAFCERAIYRVNGPGLGNGGTSGGFTEPVLVATNEGAVGPRSTIVSDIGVFFISKPGRGITLLTPSFSTLYVGAPVENLVSGAVTGACVVPALQQVRFSFTDRTLVYDTYHRQWYRFTHGSGGPTCIWNDVHTATSSTSILYDSATAWDDAGAGYVMQVKLGWVGDSAARASDLRIYRLGLNGTSLATHHLSVRVAYDGDTVGEELVALTSVTAGPLWDQWRVGPNGVCSVIEVTIRDALMGLYFYDVVLAAAGMRLNELVFELAHRATRMSREA